MQPVQQSCGTLGVQLTFGLFGSKVPSHPYGGLLIEPYKHEPIGLHVPVSWQQPCPAGQGPGPSG